MRGTSVLWIGLSFVFFVFANSWEPGVGLDTATYGVIARELLNSGDWFRPKLAPGIFDPFVEHPYLGLWLNAISIKLLGATAQGIHFSSSVLGIAGVLAFFAAIRRLIDENTALLATLCLLSINVYMNFMSSGWLDMPMVSFMLVAFYFSSRVTPEGSALDSLATGFFLSLAVLVKGAAAVGIFPVALFFLMRSGWNFKAICFALTGFIAPLALFTWGHYSSQGFLFWKSYWYRQFVVHNDIQEAATDPVGAVWYIRDALTHAHLVALLFIPGLVLMWKRNHRLLACAVALEFIIHFAVYGFSHRHNRQYLVPVFPWLALGAAFLISQRMKVNTLNWSRGLFYVGVAYFFLVSFFPITVHNVGSAGIFALSNDVKRTPIKNIYFEATEEDRVRGEMTSSYVAWYWDRVPVMFDSEEMPKVLLNLTNEDGILLLRNLKNDSVFQIAEHICAWNDLWILLSTAENCSTLERKRRDPMIKRVPKPLASSTL
ncbi:ArnT family glycosyltransferase [Bdellovibrio bacteriovorus]|uniref:ArnT family glycosyltransferase n=1 Tax=Bdellovibrio bacteriovorus TaxID=959 RepID=UPI0035A6BFC6